MIDSEYQGNILIPSIFCNILEKNRPLENEYSGDLYFEKVSFDTISYPQPRGLLKLNPFLEEDKLEKAKKTCNDKNKVVPYLLVSGDFSGIQDTVYTISSKGALKSLRARSFMLELLCEHICYELIITACVGDYKTFRNHVIFSGGGNICLLLPNTIENKSRFKNFKEIINNWAFEEFTGKLYIALSYIELTDADLQKNSFRSKWQELSDKIEEDKKQKFRWKLKEIFDKDFPEEPEQRTNQEECQICHRDDIKVSTDSPFYDLTNFDPIASPQELTEEAEKHDVVHSLCYRLFRLGDKLTEFSHIFRTSEHPNPSCDKSKNSFLCFPSIDNRPVFYLISRDTPKGKNIECVWKINAPEDNNQGCIPFLYANYVRKVSELPSGAIEKEKEIYFAEHNKELQDLTNTSTLAIYAA